MNNVPREKVRFRVLDLIHPHPARVLVELFRELQIEGEIVEQTNDGDTTFLVIRVPGLSEPVIVPLDRTQLAGPSSGPLTPSSPGRA